MTLFHIISLIKACVGVSMIYGVYYYINPRLDPLAAIGFGATGIFLLLRGLSFRISYGLLWLILPRRETLSTLCYKISFLIGGFGLTNMLLFFGERWDRLSGLIVLGLFCGLGFLLFFRYDEGAETE
ncbi:MAG: hypothetical protein NZL83_03780 [Candidatus Absconditabacterales bacterium]|nr:hypothetical protein [Candidatus Absconditabacterales bacterium]